MKRIVFIIACFCLLACKTSKESINIEQQGTTQATHKEETNSMKFSSFQFSIDSIVTELRKYENTKTENNEVEIPLSSALSLEGRAGREAEVSPIRTKIYGIRAAKKDTVFLLKQVTDTIVKVERLKTTETPLNLPLKWRLGALALALALALAIYLNKNQ